jgi:hypothetical protein
MMPLPPLPPAPGYGEGVSVVELGGDYSDEEAAFLMQMERYKRTYRRPYPTWREVLRVVRSLGYRKVETPQ